MEEPTAAGQPAEYLESLLQILACPLDNTVPLSAVRNAAGEVVALKSSDAEYPVVHNVPCLIPGLGEAARGDLPLWRAHQKKMWQEYKGGDDGVFTRDDSAMGRQVGEIIARLGGGLWLDVGCGAKVQPVYMAASGERAKWIGVDPFSGDTARRFPFVQGLGEYLPFLPEVFDGALYASTIYHHLDPRRSLARVHSVLKPGGKVLVWYSASRPGLKYVIWKGLRFVGVSRMYHEDYQWAFTRKSMRTELEAAGFAADDEVWLCATCSDLPKCDHAFDYLAAARRA